MRIGLPEILLIALLVVLFVNPKELPGLFRKAGRLMQQIKGMRESFIREMNEIEREIGTPMGTARNNGGKPAGADTTRMVLREGSKSLPIDRRVQKEYPPAAPTSIHVFLGTGMGDRVVFQGIIGHAIAKCGPDARVISVILDPGPEYFVKSYRPTPHEIWTIPRPEHRDAPEIQVARQVRELASTLFPASTSLDVFDHTQNPGAGDSNAGVVNAELYTWLSNTVARDGVYPQYSVDPEILASVRRKLERHLPEFSGRPFAAVHCRQRQHAPEKNPLRRDMLALAEKLKKRGVLLALLPEREGPNPDLAKVCDFACPFDPTLQEPACLLKLCDVLIGGDSGPAHLAAAVGTPVVSLRYPETPWLRGPFCESARCAPVVGTLVRQDGRIALSFDVEAAIARAVEFLHAKDPAVPYGQARTNDPRRTDS